MSLFSVLNIAQSGLSSSSAALSTVSQNVANANTKGYAVRNVDLATESGGGVQFQGVDRKADTFTQNQVASEQGKLGASDARGAALTNAESLVAPSGGGGIADSVNSFFASANTLATTPSDPSARQAVISQAQSLAASISSVSTGISAQRGDLLVQAQSVAGTASSDLAQVARLNQSISSAVATGADASDMRDQRDVLLDKLSTSIGARAIEDKNGSMLVIAGGTTLVTGNSASSLSVGQDSSGNLTFAASRTGGNSVDISSNITSGQLGGIREARDTDLVKTQGQLDQYAYEMSNTINAVHSAAYAPDGKTGQNIFVVPTGVAGAAATMAVDPGLIGHPEKIATAKTAADAVGGNSAALDLANLADTGLPSGGTPSASFGNVAATIGSAKQSATSESQLRTATVAQAQALHSSITGVSVDEEMVNLSKFSNAYQANSKVIATVNSLFDSILQIL